LSIAANTIAVAPEQSQMAPSCYDKTIVSWLSSAAITATIPEQNQRNNPQQLAVEQAQLQNSNEIPLP